MSTTEPSPVPIERFALDPDLHHLNHGSFGGVLHEVRQAQDALRNECDRDSMAFFAEVLPEGQQRALAALADFLGARAEDLVFVRNATEGVAAVMSSLGLGPDAEVLVNDHEYGACVKAALRTGARVRSVSIPLPLRDPAEVTREILNGLGPATKLVLVSHVTSPTGVVFPLEDILDGLAERGVPALVDGAHAPGMLSLSLKSLEAKGLAYYVGNLHKWVCAPKGIGFLWVRSDLQQHVYPAITSHGHDAEWPGRSAFQSRFDWSGTDDFSPQLVLPTVLEALSGMHPEGLSGVRAANRALALEGRQILLDRLGGETLVPASMMGSMAIVRLPPRGGEPAGPFDTGGLQAALHARGFRVPVRSWPAAPERLLRISAHRYNTRGDYVALADALEEILAAE